MNWHVHQGHLTPGLGESSSPGRGEAPVPVTGVRAPEVRWGFAPTMILARATGNGWPRYGVHRRTDGVGWTMDDIFATRPVLVQAHVGPSRPEGATALDGQHEY
jgi:hypothetical protein